MLTSSTQSRIVTNTLLFMLSDQPFLNKIFHNSGGERFDLLHGTTLVGGLGQRRPDGLACCSLEEGRFHGDRVIIVGHVPNAHIGRNTAVIAVPARVKT